MRILLVLFFILTVVYLSFGDWEHPHYSYRCLENEKLELFGVHPNSTIEIDGEKKDDPACDVTQDEVGVVSIQYACMIHSKSDEVHTAVVIVNDREFDGPSRRHRRHIALNDPQVHVTSDTEPTSEATEASDTEPTSEATEASDTEPTSEATEASDTEPTSPATPASPPTSPATPASPSPADPKLANYNPTTKTAPSYVGGHGHHQFLITCKDIPDKGINKTVAHVFQEKDFNKLPDNYKEVSNVEMRFKAVNNTDAPDISSVYIGDEFYMFIKYMGDQNYSVIPEKCIAFGKPWISKRLKNVGQNSVELWNIHNHEKHPNNPKTCANYENLLEGFGRYNETLIYAKMYGFRFKDENYVTITCQVKIFRSIPDSNKANLCMNIPANPVSGRRKRNIENMPFQTHALTKRLRVFDSKDVYLAENIGQRIKWGTSLWMMIFAAVTLHT